MREGVERSSASVGEEKRSDNIRAHQSSVSHVRTDLGWAACAGVDDNKAVAAIVDRFAVRRSLKVVEDFVRQNHFTSVESRRTDHVSGTARRSKSLEILALNLLFSNSDRHNNKAYEILIIIMEHFKHARDRRSHASLVSLSDIGSPWILAHNVDAVSRVTLHLRVS